MTSQKEKVKYSMNGMTENQLLLKITFELVPLVSSNYIEHWQRYLRKRLFERILYWVNVLNWRYIRRETLIGGLLMLKDAFRAGKR